MAGKHQKNGQFTLASRKFKSAVEQFWTMKLVKFMYSFEHFLDLVRQEVLHKQPLSWHLGASSSSASKNQEVPGNHKCKQTQERKCW